MSCVFSHDDVQGALKKMRLFHSAQIELHKMFDLDFLSNLGRRNIIMSAVHEEFFGRALADSYDDVVFDGRPGQPDIVVGELNKEIECKLTSPLQSTGAISFQTDYQTIKKKGNLDYLYVIASPDFQKFCVLYFNDLTPDHFHVPPKSARGKAQMIKSLGMENCTVLHGNFITAREKKVKRLRNEIANVILDTKAEIAEVHAIRVKLQESVDNDHEIDKPDVPLKARTRRSVKQKLKRNLARPGYLKARADKKINKLTNEIVETLNSPQDDRYSFILEEIDSE